VNGRFVSPTSKARDNREGSKPKERTGRIVEAEREDGKDRPSRRRGAVDPHGAGEMFGCEIDGEEDWHASDLSLYKCKGVRARPGAFGGF
jgi:hypothetical protein